MLNKNGRLLLCRLRILVDYIISKADKENENWVGETELPSELKKPTISTVNEFENEIAGFFLRQKRDYLLAIDNADFLKKPVRKAKDITVADLTEIVSQYVLANDKHYADILAELYAAYAVKAITSSAKIVGGSIENTKMKPKFNLSRRAMKWVDETKIIFAQEVQESTRKSIANILTVSLAVNGSVQGTVNTMYQCYIEGKLDDFRKGLKTTIRNADTFDWSRARTIARTEMLSATNAGVLEGYRQSKVVVAKKWKCECGPRSRETHRAADNTVVPIDEPFIVGGYQLMHPGDRSMGAPAREIACCRCAMSAIPAALAGYYSPQHNPYNEKGVGTDKWLARQDTEFQIGYLGSKEKQRLFAEGVIGAGDKDKSLKELSEKGYIVRKDRTNTKAYTDKFRNTGKNNMVDMKVRDEVIEMLDHRNATPYEDICYMSAKTGKALFKIDTSTIPFGIPSDDKSKSFLLNCQEDLISIHNHPGSSRPSITDIATMIKYPNIKKLVVAGHDGTVYIVSDVDARLTPSMLEELYKSWYTYYKKMYPSDIAESKAIDVIYEMELFKFERR